MAKFQHAVVLAAILYTYMPQIGTDKGDGACQTLASLAVLCAAVALVAASDLARPFSCRLPDHLHFLYEIIASLLIFQVLVGVFWERAECFLVSGLPAAVDRALDGRCPLAALCPGSALFGALFVGLSYLAALAVLCTVLYGLGVLSTPPRLPRACRRCLDALKGTPARCC